MPWHACPLPPAESCQPHILPRVEHQYANAPALSACHRLAPYILACDAVCAHPCACLLQDKFDDLQASASTKLIKLITHVATQHYASMDQAGKGGEGAGKPEEPPAKGH